MKWLLIAVIPVVALAVTGLALLTKHADSRAGWASYNENAEYLVHFPPVQEHEADGSPFAIGRFGGEVSEVGLKDDGHAYDDSINTDALPLAADLTQPQAILDQLIDSQIGPNVHPKDTTFVIKDRRNHLWPRTCFETPASEEICAALPAVTVFIEATAGGQTLDIRREYVLVGRSVYSVSVEEEGKDPGARRFQTLLDGFSVKREALEQQLKAGRLTSADLATIKALNE